MTVVEKNNSKGYKLEATNGRRGSGFSYNLVSEVDL